MTSPGTAEQAAGEAILHLQSDMTAGVADFETWCNDSHHPEVLARDGFLSARRLELVGDYAYTTPGSQRFLTMYELRDERAAAQPAAAAETPIPAAVSGLTYTRTVYRQTSCGAATQEIGTAVLNVMVEVEAGWQDAYDAWYDDEHLPAVLAVPGVLGARRFVAADGGRRYLALYQLVDPAVVGSEAFARAGAPTPRATELSAHRSLSLQVYRQVFPAEGALVKEGTP